MLDDEAHRGELEQQQKQQKQQQQQLRHLTECALEMTGRNLIFLKIGRRSRALQDFCVYVYESQSWANSLALAFSTT